MREIPKEKEKKIKRNMTILVLVVFIVGLFVSCDLLLVTKAQIGPFFAIPLKTYQDGGTKEYYGLGYKVIKYHQEKGRRDTQVGFWTMPYSIEPTEISVLDLALAFRNYPKDSYQKYYNQYLQIEGEIKKVDSKEKKITLFYQDEEGSYSLDVDCMIADKDLDYSSYKKGQTVRLVGTFKSFDNSKKNSPMKITIKDSFLF